MPSFIDQPTVIAAAGTKPKQIEEFVGLANSGNSRLSVALMDSPQGWEEPGQRPEFEEITIVLRGLLRVEHESGVIDVREGQGVTTAPGEWVRYSTPKPGGAEYVAVCLPAFSSDSVRRDQHAGGDERSNPGATVSRRSPDRWESQGPALLEESLFQQVDQCTRRCASRFSFRIQDI